MNDYKQLFLGFLQFIIPFIIVVFIWEIIVSLQLISQLPAPTALVIRFYSLAFENTIIWNHMINSFYRLILGYLLAAGLGIGLGTLMGLNKTIANMFTPFLSLLIAVPTIAWVPILLITLGLGEETVIVAIFLGGFFAITYSMMHGIRMVNKNLSNAARIMGGKKQALFFHVLLPGSLVSLIPGLRLAIGYSWRALVGAEMLAAILKLGVGKMIYGARFFNDIQLMFIGLIIIGVAGLSLDHLLMRYIEKLTIERWGMVTEG